MRAQILSKPEKDLYEYEQFAKALAKSIQQIDNPIGYTISVEGPWGSGKTTCLDYLRKELKQLDNIEEVPFSPWLISGSTKLVESLISTVMKGLTGISNEEIRNIKKKSGAVGKAAATIVTPSPLQGYLQNVIKSLEGVFDKDLIEEKKEAHTILNSNKALNKRLVVTIDDIDRLQKKEIRELFAALKAILDLPNIVFVVAFDRNVVSKALDTKYGVNGNDFLEKIIQAPFNIPHPSKTILVHQLINGLESIFDSGFKTELDGARFWNIFHYGFRSHFNTPRNVIRFLNVIKLTYPPVRSDVNPTDYFAMEALRIFEPEAYFKIRNNPELFLGAPELNNPANSLSSIFEIFEIDKQQFPLNSFPTASEGMVPQKLAILRELFPKAYYTVLKGNFNFASDEWFHDRRVCDPDRFWSYFMVEEKVRRMGDLEFNDILNLASSSQALEERIVELSNQPSVSGHTRAALFFERLTLSTAKMNQNLAKRLLEIVFRNADAIWQQDTELVLRDRRVVSLNSELEIARLKMELVANYKAGAVASSLFWKLGTQRESILNKLVANKQHSIWCCFAAVNSLTNSDSFDHISPGFLSNLKRTAVSLLEDQAALKRVIESPYLLDVLVILKQWDEEELLDSLEKDFFSCAEKLSRLLESALNVSDQQVRFDAVSSITYILKTEHLNSVFEPEKLADAIQRFYNYLTVDSKTRAAVDLFLAVFKKQKAN